MKKKKQMTKRMLSLLLTAVLSISLWSQATVDVFGAPSPEAEDMTPVPNDETGIPDRALYQYLLKENDKNADGMFSLSEAREVYWLGIYPKSAEERVRTFKNLSVYCPNITGMQYIDYNEDGGCTVFKAEDFREFANIPAFDDLNLYGVKVEDVSSVAKISQLENLSLDYCGITDASFVNAENFPNLERLDLGRNEGLASVPASLAEMTNLRMIGFVNCGLMEFPDMSKLVNLEDLEIGGNNFTVVSGISDLTNLERLGLFGNKLTTLPDLSKLVNLTYLDIGYMDLTEAPSLSHMTKLESVRLYGNKFTSLPDMTGLANLQDVLLSDNLLSEEEIMAKLPVHITADASWVADAVNRQSREVNTKVTTDVTEVQPGETVNVTFTIENLGAPIKNLLVDLSTNINGTQTYIVPAEDSYTFTETGISMDIAYGETFTITYAVETEESWKGNYLSFRGEAYLTDYYLSGGTAFSDYVRVGGTNQGGSGSSLADATVKSVSVSNKDVVLTDDNYMQEVVIRIALEGTDAEAVKEGDQLEIYYGLEGSSSGYLIYADYDSAAKEFVAKLTITAGSYELNKEYKLTNLRLPNGFLSYSENLTLFKVTNQLTDQIPPVLEGLQIYLNDTLQKGYTFALKSGDVIEIRANASDNSGTVTGNVIFYAENIEEAYQSGKNYYIADVLQSGTYDLEGKFTIGANQYEGTYVLSSLNLYDKYKNTKTYTGEEAAALYKEVTAKNPSYYVPDYDYDYEEEEVVAPTPVPVVRPQTVTPPVQTQEEMSENKAVVLDEAAIAEKAEEAANAKAGETVAVNMRKEDGSLATELPVDILNAVRGKDVNVVLDMGTYSWIINGNDITAENLSAINLEVVLDAVAVPNEIVAQKAGEQPVRQISLTHNGEFGFAAKLSINMGSEYAGEYANLYYYSPAEELEFMNAGLIKEDGNVELAFSHASDYVIVVDEDRTEAETVVVENTEEAEDTETISTESVNVEAEKESGSSGMRVAVIAIIAVIIAAAFVITKKKK